MKQLLQATKKKMMVYCFVFLDVVQNLTEPENMACTE